MRLFLLILSVFCLTALATQPAAKKYRVWVDGIYDLAHYGHQRSFEKARNTAAERFKVSPERIEVIVGVNGGDIKAYKREPVFALEQRVAQIQSFKGVDLVVADAPLVFDASYIDKYKLDLVMHGDDYTPEKIEKYFSIPFKMGIYASYPYEPGISTTDILRRATNNTLESILEKNNFSCEERAAIEKTLQLIKDAKI